MKPTFIALLALCLSVSAASSFKGKVVSVADGDTLTVVTSDKKMFKIRLQGIDAPENSQPGGKKAQKALSDKVLDKEVTVNWSEYDAYKRVLGHITIGSRWINMEIVYEGWAWHYVQYSSNTKLAAAQIAARTARRGLWSAKNPTAPWAWRKRPKPTAKKGKPGALRILSLLPNPAGKDEGREQVTLVNTSKKAVSLKGWSLRDKAKNVYGLSGSIAASGRRTITMKSNSMPMNNDGDTIMLVQGNISRHSVSYKKEQARSGVMVKAGK